MSRICTKCDWRLFSSKCFSKKCKVCCKSAKCSFHNYNFVGNICNICNTMKSSSYCSQKVCKFCCKDQTCNKHYGIPYHITSLQDLEPVLIERFHIPKDIVTLIYSYVNKSCETCKFMSRYETYKECNYCHKKCCSKCLSKTFCCRSIWCINCKDPNGDCKTCYESEMFEQRYESFKAYF